MPNYQLQIYTLKPGMKPKDVSRGYAVQGFHLETPFSDAKKVTILIVAELGAGRRDSFWMLTIHWLLVLSFGVVATLTCLKETCC